MEGLSVCFLLRRAYPANVSTAFNYYPVHLARCGVKVTVIAAKQASDDTPENESVNGVDVFRIPTNLKTARSVSPTIFAIRAFRLLGRIMKTQTIDILHMLAFPNLGFILYPISTWKSPKIKILDVRATAVSSGLADRFSRQTLCLQRKLFNNVVILNTQIAQAIFGSLKGIDIIPLGADFSQFRPAVNPTLRKQFGINDNELALIYVGNLHYPRGLDRLLKAFHLATQKVPFLRLIIVGGGGDWNRLKNIAEELQINDKVVFTGYVPYEDVPKYMQASDIGISYVRNIIQYRDQPPIKTVEYLASGLPVVATDTPGNRDFIRQNWNGLLAPDDPQEFSKAIISLVKDEKLRSEIALKSRESMKEYDYDNIVRHKLIPLYKRYIKAYKQNKKREL